MEDDTKEISKAPKTQYCYWDAENHCYMVYDTKEEAVTECEDEIVELFEATYKSLGRFKHRHAIVKVRK